MHFFARSGIGLRRLAVGSELARAVGRSASIRRRRALAGQGLPGLRNSEYPFLGGMGGSCLRGGAGLIVALGLPVPLARAADAPAPAVTPAPNSDASCLECH